ncbi:MAG: nucleotide exchange factor GrpE [Acidimicrobiia bacterium]
MTTDAFDPAGDGPATVPADGERDDGFAAPSGDLPAEPGLTLEELLADLERVTAERDELLGVAQRTQAEFENFRKRAARQLADDVARESGRLVESVLPVLDAFDYAAAHRAAGADGGGEPGPDADAVAALRDQLLGQLAKEGLERLDPLGGPFDPTEHEAVAHEPGDGGEPLVAETLRAGYRWRSRLLRPVMVRVRD